MWLFGHEERLTRRNENPPVRSASEAVAQSAIQAVDGRPTERPIDRASARENREPPGSFRLRLIPNFRYDYERFLFH
ncbi:hypothetical protein BRD01_04535 [Halobacteriales archaeon QS_8_65_32]|nr:MAG: hypothetical protein BRD01_04535 [Halobacteriales archaeon QS_8_65_32]